MSKDELLAKAEKGLFGYLDQELQAGHIDKGYYDIARKNVMPNLEGWLSDPYDELYDKNIKQGIRQAIEDERWPELAEAFVQEIKFGTGGIRGKMAFRREAVLKMQEEGIDVPILKGPATINDKVLLLKSVGVARYGRDNGLNKIVIGYDSRVQGEAFAKLITRLFLAYGLTVYLFDEACPYPEVTFAIPNVKADMGILISASHNDYRYNGYKLSCGNGSQFDLAERNKIYDNYIVTAKPEQIKLIDLDDAEDEQLWFLGGSEPRGGFDYHGREHRLIDMHSRHIDHVKSFLLRKDLLARQSEDGKSLNIGFSAFHGAGRVAVPRILNEVGFSDIKKIKKLDQLDGMFPCFRSDPGKEQQPDPGDPRAAEIAVNAFKEEYPGEFENTDILIGTDPDADRCGVVIKVPEEQRQLYGGKDYVLLSADYAWALLIWYRLNYEVENYGKVRDAEKKFIVQSHSTSDVIIRMAQKFGIGYIKSWVGFAMLANSVRRVWDGEEIPKLHEGRLKPGDEKCHPVMYDSNGMDNGQRCFNIGAMEQSNGYSLLGGPPKDKFSLGEDGHVRDKDGTFAALLLAEIAAYAKDQGTTIYRLLDEKLFLDPEVGLFVNYYEPGPMDGEYEGLAGFTHKKNILMKAMALHEDRKPGTTLAGKEIISSTTYLTGKYDAQNWPGFPDEGIRLYFSEDKYDWLIIRPSGTSNALRFHVQLRAEAVTEENLPKQKKELLETAKAIVAEVREITGATE